MSANCALLGIRALHNESGQGASERETLLAESCISSNYASASERARLSSFLSARRPNLGQIIVSHVYYIDRRERDIELYKYTFFVPARCEISAYKCEFVNSAAARAALFQSRE
jgi:hypothetical protein